LSIVQAIAEAHGGRVELDSDPGRGATFTLVLPADADPTMPGRTPTPP
jgi:signal transduction histidine kinase